MKDTTDEYTHETLKITIFEYSNSGIPGDHSIACDINLMKNKVVWTGFKNFSNMSHQSFHYFDLTLEFDEDQYLAAIQKLLNSKVKELFA